MKDKMNHFATIKLFLLTFSLFFIINITGKAQLFHFLDYDVNTLSFQQAKDFKLSTSLLWRKANLQLGYSPFKYMSIVGAFALRNDVARKRFGISYTSSGYSYNLGVGLYKHRSFIDKKNLTGLLIDGHLGIGQGQIETRDDIYYAELWYNKYFLRGGIGIELHKVRFYYSLSAIALEYTKGRTLNPALNRADLAENFSRNVSLNDTWFFVERTWRMYCKIYAHEFFIGVTFLRNKGRIKESFLEKSSFNMGVQIDLNKLQWRKDT